MKRILFFAIMLFITFPLFSNQILFAEQYYNMYHQHFYYYPEDSAENIYYLGMALRSDFANPLNALAVIENEIEWEKYRYLFYMHVNLLIIDCYIKMAVKYDKFEARFYNYPWKYANLESLNSAEAYYNLALEYWDKALEWAEKANDPKFNWIWLDEIQYWEDEKYRMNIGDLDYSEIINRELARLEEVRTAFEAMDETTY